MKKLSTASKVIRLLCAPLIGYSIFGAINYFALDQDWGMVHLTIILVAGLFTLVINTWHN